MKLETKDDTLRVSAIHQLAAANAGAFRDWVRGALDEHYTSLDIDLSQTSFIDSSGLGALIALHKTIGQRKGTFRLLNPQPPVQQILELTRMNQIFEIVKA